MCLTFLGGRGNAALRCGRFFPLALFNAMVPCTRFSAEALPIFSCRSRFDLSVNVRERKREPPRDCSPWNLANLICALACASFVNAGLVRNVLLRFFFGSAIKVSETFCSRHQHLPMSQTGRIYFGMPLSLDLRHVIFAPRLLAPV